MPSTEPTSQNVVLAGFLKLAHLVIHFFCHPNHRLDLEHFPTVTIHFILPADNSCGARTFWINKLHHYLFPQVGPGKRWSSFSIALLSVSLSGDSPGRFVFVLDCHL